MNVDAAASVQNYVTGATLIAWRSRAKALMVRVGLAALLGGALLVGFLAYLSPAMRLNWETIASMCGL